MRAIYIVASLAFSAWASYVGEPLAAGNSESFTLIVTVLTVFAGFLVAVVVILGDPALIPGDSWRSIEARRESIENELIRHSWLFMLYMFAIAMLFVSAMIAGSHDVMPTTKVWFRRTYLFASIFSFMLTLRLPSSLLRIQMKRLDAELERRRSLAIEPTDEGNQVDEGGQR